MELACVRAPLCELLCKTPGHHPLPNLFVCHFADRDSLLENLRQRLTFRQNNRRRAVQDCCGILLSTAELRV